MQPVCHEERVLIRAPIGADAANTARVLEHEGFAPVICDSLDHVAHEFLAGCGVIVLTEEAVIRHDVERLRDALLGQPKWSDVPVVLITSGGQTTAANKAASTTAVSLLGAQCNLTLIERPLRAVTLTATLAAAMRSRRRQYEVRNLILERDGLLWTLERRVDERTARLRQIVEELEAFSYSVSHDLRAPLRALDAYARALLEDCGETLPPHARGYAEKIARSAQRMDHLTQDLLAYTRVSRHGVPLRRVELEPLIQDVVLTYPSITRWTDQIRIDSPLPAVLGHAPSLIQCVSNLLDNAFKFTHPQRLPRVLVHAARATEGRVRVWIEDNGVGIDPAHHERIFGIFERVDTAAEGTGIGLAIVRRAIERMGGSVGVESTLGDGARFWLELQLADAATPAAPTPPLDDNPSAGLDPLVIH